MHRVACPRSYNSFYPYNPRLVFGCSILIPRSFLSTSSASFSKDTISQEAPGTSLLTDCETTAAARKSGAFFNTLTNKTITSFFNHVPSLSNKAGIPVTEPLDSCSIPALVNFTRAFLVLAVAYTTGSVVLISSSS